MDYPMLKAELETKKQQILTEIDQFIERAVNFEELIDLYGEKDAIDHYEFEWNDTADQRHFENLEHTLWMIGGVIDTIDELVVAGDDKKKLHVAKKGIETLVTEIRRVKKESKEFIAEEQRVITESDSVLGLLDEIRDMQ